MGQDQILSNSKAFEAVISSVRAEQFAPAAEPSSADARPDVVPTKRGAPVTTVVVTEVEDHGTRTHRLAVAAQDLGLAAMSAPLSAELVLRHWTAYKLAGGGEPRHDEAERLTSRALKVAELAQRVTLQAKKLELLRLSKLLVLKAVRAGEFKVPSVPGAVGREAFDALVAYAYAIAMDVVYAKATKFRKDVDAMASIGALAAIDAVETWNPQEGAAFHAWVRVIALSSVNHHFTSEMAQMTSTTSDLQDVVAEILRVKRKFENTGIVPDLNDLWAVLEKSSTRGLTYKRVKAAYETLTNGGHASLEVMKESGQEPGQYDPDDYRFDDFGKLVSRSPNRLAHAVWIEPDWSFLNALHAAAPYEGVPTFLERHLGSRPSENEVQCAEEALKVYFTLAGSDEVWAAFRPRNSEDRFEPGKPETAWKGARRAARRGADVVGDADLDFLLAGD